MRIFRDHDDDHDHDSDDDHDGEQPRGGINGDKIAADTEVLVDEIADFLSAATAEADHLDAHPSTKSHLRLVPPLPTQQATAAGDLAPGPEAKPHTRGQIWRASAAGSFVVVGLATSAAWGQPAEVGAPIALYGLGWLVYLTWNAARRPSPSLALAAFTERRAARAQQHGNH